MDTLLLRVYFYSHQSARIPSINRIFPVEMNVSLLFDGNSPVVSLLLICHYIDTETFKQLSVCYLSPTITENEQEEDDMKKTSYRGYTCMSRCKENRRQWIGRIPVITWVQPHITAGSEEELEENFHSTVDRMVLGLNELTCYVPSL